MREIVQERSVAKLMMEARGGLGKRYRELPQDGSDEERLKKIKKNDQIACSLFLKTLF